MSDERRENPVSQCIRADCPNCGPKRYSDVISHHSVSWNDDEAGIWGVDEYRILECRGCRTVFFQKEQTFSEDMDHRLDHETGDWEEYIPTRVYYWPTASKRNQPTWASGLNFVDYDLSLLFDDIYVAFEHDIHVPAAIAIRTTFDRATELLGIDPVISFEEKLDELLSTGRIGKDERDILDVLTNAGSAAAHRGWRPKTENLNTMISVLEAFLHRTFFLGDETKKLRETIPAKIKRRAKKKKEKSGETKGPA